MHRAPTDLLWRVVRTLGELALTLGVVVLLFVAYEVWGTDLVAAQAQGQLGDELHAQWGSGTGSTGAGPVGTALPELTTAPAVGAPFAFLHVPRLGADWSRAVVEGTAQEQLAQGPGHYAGTALPGEPGNFAVAGHRVGRGSPFLDVGHPPTPATRWSSRRPAGGTSTGCSGPTTRRASPAPRSSPRPTCR